MADECPVADEPQSAPATPGGAWAWHPPLPLAGVPVFVWPPRPLAALKYLLSLAFLLQWNTLRVAMTHTGFEALTFRGRPILMLGSFHHQLHHRYYDCNYGNPPMPWDRWFGTDHDGTPRAMAEVARRRRARLRPAAGRP